MKKIACLAILAASLFVSSAFANDFKESYNYLSAQANFPMKISGCKEKDGNTVCDTTGARRGGSIGITTIDGKKQYTFITGSKDLPGAGDLNAWANAYSILILLTDSSFSAEKIGKMVPDMMKQGIKTGKEIVKKENGHTYSFYMANLAKLGLGEGCLLTYTAR